MNFEKYRIRTFKNWTNKNVSRSGLARLGFYFFGETDQVQCHFCEVEIHSWVQGDNILFEHSKYSPNCKLLNREFTSNVSIDEDRLQKDLSYLHMSRDVCGQHNEIFQTELDAFNNDMEQTEDFFSEMNYNKLEKSLIEIVECLKYVKDILNPINKK